MLQITADIFSGRPNPTWIVTDEKEVRAVLRELTRNRELLADAPPLTAGLGFRGVLVEPLSDELTQGFDLPPLTYIALGVGGVADKGAEIAERLIALMPQTVPPATADAAMPALDADLQTFLLRQITLSKGRTMVDGAGAAMSTAAAEEAVRAMCYYDTCPYNPGFWNNDANVRLHNNCYHYASNKRRDSFRVLPGGGQPGAGCGQMYGEITCAEVTRAALCDGLHRRYDCFPDSEYPRHLVALVIAPGPGFVDFHWYRKMQEGFWGHKPGSTAVVNVDNSNKLIMDPVTCDRGPYTQFCGYFYTCWSQKIK